jgi:benzoylformate decarboxylase
VVALVGDGSSLYSLTAWWTAAHHRLPVLWVILNNSSYRILKENVRHDGVDAEAADRLVGADLTDPKLDFVSLAAGMGVRGQRVTDPDELGDAFTAALALRKPFVLDVAISGRLSGT